MSKVSEIMQIKLLGKIKEVERELYAHYNEEAVIYCCKIYYKDELQEVENEEGVRGYLINGNFVSEDDMEYFPFDAYINYSLEVSIFKRKDNSVIGAHILVSKGGPTIYINTIRGCIEGTWGDCYLECPISQELVSAINDVVK